MTDQEAAAHLRRIRYGYHLRTIDEGLALERAIQNLDPTDRASHLPDPDRYNS